MRTPRKGDYSTLDQSLWRYGRMHSSGLHYRQGIWCIVIHEMPWCFLCLEPGSDTYPCQETLYRSESCRRRLRRIAPYGPPRMVTQVRPVYRRHHLCSSIACRSTCSCPLHLLHMCNLSFMIGMPNRSCIVELWANQCFV